MPRAPILFAPNEESGQEPLAGAGRVAHNVVIDARGAVSRRPGLKAYSGALDSVIDADGIKGIVSTPDGKLWAVGGGFPNANLYRVTAGGTKTLPGDSPGLEIASGARAVITQTEALLVMTAGRRPQKVDIDTEDSDKLGGSPPDCTHIATHAGRLLCNNLGIQSQINYSGIATGGATSGHEDWATGLGTGGFFSAEARPDPVVALAENTNEVFVWGTTSMQVFVSDPQFVYSPGSTREYGLIAPYSVINRDQAFAWLDHKRRFVISDGRTVQVISKQIQHTLDKMTKVDDCFGYRVHLGWVDALVWTFPTDGRTYVYAGGLWSQWGSNPGVFRVTAHHQRPDTGENVVGDSNGYLSLLDLDTSTDRGDAIVADVSTGFENRDTDSRKQCRNVYLSFQRGEATETEPEAHLYYRDHPGEWLGPIRVGLGVSSDDEIVVPLGPLGVYRRREWRLVFAGSENFRLIRAVEDYEVLSY